MLMTVFKTVPGVSSETSVHKNDCICSDSSLQHNGKKGKAISDIFFRRFTIAYHIFQVQSNLGKYLIMITLINFSIRALHSEHLPSIQIFLRQPIVLVNDRLFKHCVPGHVLKSSLSCKCHHQNQSLVNEFRFYAGNRLISMQWIPILIFYAPTNPESCGPLFLPRCHKFRVCFMISVPQLEWRVWLDCTVVSQVDISFACYNFKFSLAYEFGFFTAAVFVPLPLFADLIQY